METVIEQNPPAFVDRRGQGDNRREGGPERRQFTSSQSGARPEVAEFAAAIDRYKLENHRRFITYEEIFNIMTRLGYHR